MSTHHADPQERIAPVHRYSVLGVDDTGAEHVIDWHRDRVYVIDDSEIAHVADVPEVDHWMAFVADRRGWAERRYYATMGEWLGDALAGWG